MEEEELETDRGSASASSTGRGIVLNIVGNGLLPLVALLTAPILARSLGVEGRGTVATATSPYLLLSAVASLGLPDAMTHFVARRAVDVQRTGVRLVILSFGLGAASIGGVALASNWLSGGSADLARLIVIVTTPLPLYLAIGVVRGIASGLQAWGCVAGEQAIFAVGRLVAILVLLAIGHLNVLTASFVLTIVPLIGVLAYLPLLRRPPPPPIEDVRMKNVMSYGARTWVGAVSGVLIYRLDQVLMAPLSSAEQLGLYVVAVAIGELPVIISTAIRNVAFASESGKASLEILGRLTRLNTLLTLGVSLALGALSPWMVPFFFGHAFDGALPACIVMLISAVAGSLGAVAGAGLAGRGRAGARSIILIGACVVNVLLILLLVPSYGAFGAALATLGGTLFMSVVTLWVMKAHFDAKIRDFVVFRMEDVAIVSAATRVAIRQLRGRGGGEST